MGEHEKLGQGSCLKMTHKYTNNRVWPIDISAYLFHKHLNIITTPAGIKTARSDSKAKKLKSKNKKRNGRIKKRTKI